MGEKDFYVVGIGLSAGGQSPLIALLSLLPTGLNAAFVVLPHLSVLYKSSLDKILQKYTEMPVVRVDQDELLVPGRVYVLPENKMMVLEDQHLVLRERRPEEKINYAVNEFFHSLALQAGERAIGVVLSGANDDGVDGAITINSCKGTVLTQDPATAQFPRMPQEIIDRDHPETIQSPEDLAGELIERISGRKRKDL